VPGGFCQVTQRIDEVPNPALRETLHNKTEEGFKLNDREMAVIYHNLAESGFGQFKELVLSPHAQYRMDLRSVPVDTLKKALGGFGRWLGDLKAKKPQEALRVRGILDSGEKIEWFDPATGIELVFRRKGTETVIVSVWQKGVPDPKGPPPQGCRVASVVAKYKASVLKRLAVRIYERTSSNPMIGVILARESLKEAGLMTPKVAQVFTRVRHLGVEGLEDLQNMVRISLDGQPEDIGSFCVELLKAADHKEAASDLNDALELDIR
jgi:hypothetical protein